MAASQPALERGYALLRSDDGTVERGIDPNVTESKPIDLPANTYRVIDPTTIPDERDDLVTGSFGAKFTLPKGFTLVGNALFPLNRGGMRPDIIYTTGVALDF